jgi:hypothetical protein
VLEPNARYAARCREMGCKGPHVGRAGDELQAEQHPLPPQQGTRPRHKRDRLRSELTGL